MRKIVKQQALIADVVSVLFILLFVYAAASKLLDYQKFTIQLGKSPILSAFSRWMTWLVPSTEIGIAISLFFKKFQLKALYGSFSLMVMFSAYIIAILNFSDYIPCSCGGILENMTWAQHLWFNITFVILGGLGVLSYPLKPKEIIGR